MRILFSILLIIGLCLFVEKIDAKHIIGGDMYYECVGLDNKNEHVTFKVTLKLYRDCSNLSGAPYDQQIKIGVYEKYSNNSYRVDQVIQDVRLLQPVKSIDPDVSNPCLVVPPNVCVEEGKYEFYVTLTIISNSYYLAYQRCCRNETITNIDNPGDDGAAFTIEITPEAQRTCNNSPQFKNFPPVVICANNPLKFDHSVTDMEGDSVSYSFCTPLIAGGKDGMNPEACFGVRPNPLVCIPPYNSVVFRFPQYSTEFPMGGVPVVKIDSITGLITGQPNILGQFVVGVCIHEYRNGILLTETRRDFQFNVAFCEPKVVAKLQSDSILNGSRFVVNSCGNQTIDFNNLSTEEKNILNYQWIFNINGIDDTITTRNARVTFPKLGVYNGQMILNKGTDCSDTADINVNIYPGLNADFLYSYDTCIAGPVVFKDKSFSGSGTITNWNWSFANAGNSILENPDFVFNTPGNKNVKLQIVDINKCVDDTTISIRYFPVPPLLIIDPNITNGCTPLDVCLNNLSIPIDSTYKIDWDFGDGTHGNQISPCHIYPEEGVYSLKLEVTSPIGCYTSRQYPDLIRIRKSPEADFTMTPDKLSSLHRNASLDDISKFSDTREWIINNRDKFFNNPLNYAFRDTGHQKIMLIAISKNGCSDTLIKNVDVEPIVTLFMPNAFTPNGDSENDGFAGKGVFEGMKNYEMTIWDRWGMRLFVTNDPEIAWNGQLDNTGIDLPNGVYVYQVKYTTPRDKVIEIKGFATLLR